MNAKNVIVGSAVAIGAAALTVKKLFSDSELNKTVVENGKKVGSSVKDLGNSVCAVAKNAVDTADVELRSIRNDVSKKLKDKEPEIDARVAETKKKIQVKAEQVKAKFTEHAETADDQSETADESEE